MRRSVFSRLGVVAVLCGALLGSQAWAAAFTSKATGNWNATGQTTWNESGSPTSGDTVTIATGHVVTVTANVTVGTSPTTSPSGVVTVNGQLVINQGVTFTLLGSLVQGGTTGSNGVVTNNGNILLDTSVGGFNYAIVVGQEHTTTAKLVCPGTVSNRPTISVAGSLKGRIIDSGWIGGGRVEADYTDFSGLGYSTTPAIAFSISTASDNLYLRNCTFTGCGQIKSSLTLGAQSKLIISDCLFSGSTGSTVVTLNGSTPSGAGVRTFTNNRIDGTAEFYPSTGFTIDNNLFNGGFAVNGFTVVSCAYNVFFNDVTPPYSSSNNYFFGSTSNDNPHPVQIGQNSAFSITGAVLDFPAGSAGDLVVGGPTSGSHAVDITYCLVIPNASLADPGKLYGPLTDYGVCSLEHNTVISTRFPSGSVESGAGNLGESNDGKTGMYDSAKSNYIYSPSGKGAVINRVNNNTTVNGMAAADGDYNAFNNPVTTTGSGVVAVAGTSGGYVDTTGAFTAVRVVGGSSGSFTLLVYHSDDVTTAETTTIAYNATGPTAATAIENALNTLSDGTYVVTATAGDGAVDMRVDGSGAGSGGTKGARFTVTRNGVTLTNARYWTLLRPGGTNSTGGTINVARPMFTTTTGLGAHDIVADPFFVDPSRNLATFDTAYLRNTAAQGAWTDTPPDDGTYEVGDIVSSSDASFYNGATVNFRCRVAHDPVDGNATTGRPGKSTTTSWRTNWELASSWRIRTSNASYSATSRQATPRDLWTWVRAGFAVRNPVLFKAGHDGETIGACGFNYAFFFMRRRASLDRHQPVPAPATIRMFGAGDVLDTSHRPRFRKAA